MSTLTAPKIVGSQNALVKKPVGRPEMAVTVTAPKTVCLAPVNPHESLKPSEVRGRTICSLMSPGTELSWNYNGKDFPNYPGYSAVFEATETGAEVTGIKKGDRLFCQGSHRSVQQVAAALAHKIPDALDPTHAVVARLLGVSMTTLKTTVARPGDRVLITGLGPVGYGAASLFAVAGYEVHGVEPNPGRRALIKHPGITAIHSSVPKSDAGLPGTFALVVECSGHEQATLDACFMVRKGGEVVLVGVPWQRKTDLYAHDVLHAIFHKYVHVRGGWEWELPVHESDFRPHSIVSGFKLALQWLSEGKIPLEGLIQKVDPADAQIAYDDNAAGKSKGLFTVFDWSD
jgi:threonine dehydrogenase-like Zn-dependent dehydrogenase